MVKKEEKKKNNSKNQPIRIRLTLGQKASDRLTRWAGSWIFILSFLLFLVIWIIINGYFLIKYQQQTFDPYPFILLNLILSCMAAIQAPIILMSQNRELERDRTRAEKDYAINRKAEREVENMQMDLDEIKVLIKKRTK